jgi:hypothetical protein
LMVLVEVVATLIVVVEVIVVVAAVVLESKLIRLVEIVVQSSCCSGRNSYCIGSSSSRSSSSSAIHQIRNKLISLSNSKHSESSNRNSIKTLKSQLRPTTAASKFLRKQFTFRKVCKLISKLIIIPRREGFTQPKARER